MITYWQPSIGTIDHIRFRNEKGDVVTISAQSQGELLVVFKYRDPSTERLEEIVYVIKKGTKKPGLGMIGKNS
jgi:leucyl aminopeptidase (aminopeptidase T)